jgi:LuxR family transcriptional regulator, maltose regulon positive regulatory protein
MSMPATAGRPELLRRPARGTVLRRNGGGSTAEESLLTSKITVPALPGWAVRRGRVERLVEAGTRGPLTVVTGPPGAGKTMALAWWAAARRRPGPIAWVTLDRFDNRPEILWSYIGESLRRSGAASSAELAPAGNRPAGHEFVQQVASALAAQDPPVALILDDIHLLTDPDALDGLSYVLRNASAGLHLLVASRMDPLLPLHRYRLTGELAEIRASDLAFSTPEARALMAQHGVTLSPAPLEALIAKDEGWAAGLRLAAMSMENHPDPDRLASGFGATNSAVTSYFLEEVLNAQPPEVQDVLLRTSVVDRVTPALAGELSGDGHAEAVIPRLARANGFVQPLGGDWYRYHPLFAEVLRLKLRHERPGEVTLLHRRAAAWLRHGGMLAEAVSQLAAAADWGLAARMAVEDWAVGRLTGPRAIAAVTEVFRGMPAAGDQPDPPALIVTAAMRLLDFDDQECQACLGRAEAALARLPAGQELPSRLAAALLHAAMARQSGDLDAAKAALSGAEGLLATMPGRQLAAAPAERLEPVLSRHPGAQANLLFVRGAVEMWTGNPEAAATLEEATAALDGACGWADCAGYWALLEALRGRLGAAAGLAAPAAAPAIPARNQRQNGYPRRAGQLSAAAETALAWVHLEHGRLGEASDRLSRAEDALRARPDRLVSAVACLAAARHSLGRGHAAAAARTIQSARRGWAPPQWLERRLTLTESHAYAVAGDVKAALGAAGRVRPRSAPEAAAALARAQLAAGDLDAAGQHLADQRGAPASPPPEGVRLEERLVEAELGYRGGDPARGRQALVEALRLAEPERVRLPFEMERSWIQQIFQRDPVLAERFRRLFQPARARLAGFDDDPVPVNGHAPDAVIVEELSDREQEVLRHVSGMLSTAEIAGEMYISVNTVKSHLKSIFRKLGASRRGEAVRRARQLRLI